MNSSKKEKLFKIATIILSTLLFILSAEIFLRIFGPEYYRFSNTEREYYSNPRGYFKPLRKEGTHTVYGLDYYDSVHGYRVQSGEGPSAGKKPAILVLGDSFTYGIGVKYEDIYTVRLERMLKSKGINTDVINCGVPGTGIFVINGIYKSESKKRKYPLVIYGFVLNDFGLPGEERISGSDFIDQDNGGNAYSPERKISAILNLVVHTVEKRRLHISTKAAYKEAFEGEYGSRGFNYLKKLNESVNNNGGRLMVMLFPLLYDFDRYMFGDIHNKIKSFCNDNNILVLDLFDSLKSFDAKDLWVHPTDHHPNEKAHAVIAGEAFRFIFDNNLEKLLSDE